MALTKVSYAMIQGAPVSVFDFLTEAQIANVEAGVVIDVIDAIDAAVAASRSVYFPPGVYGISRPIVLQRERMHLYGAGTVGPFNQTPPIGGFGGTTIEVMAGFTGTTLNGSTGSAAIWYQNPLGTWDDGFWIDGGVIENLTINCVNRGVEGIRLNRITQGQVLRNLVINDASVGIFGTHSGWLTEFDNVYIYQARIIGIRLFYAWNGCTFTNCTLYGGNTGTEVLLDIDSASYGNSWSGGAIEGGLVAVRLTEAQIAFHGTDFEAITYKFFEMRGLFSGSPPVLNFAAPTTTITGCTFVGVPSTAGIEMNGGVAEVHGNFFINNGAAPPPTVFCMHGVAAGDATVTGFEQQCIAESNNVARGWNNQLSTGIVFDRMTSILAGTTSVSKLQTGNTANRLPANTPYNAYLTGKSRAADAFGTAIATSPTFVTGWSARHLGDVETEVTDGLNAYVANHYNVATGLVTLEASDQGTGFTFGRAGVYANITDYRTVTTSYGALVDTINAGLRPLSDNTHRLGAASFRWSEVFAANGTINTSDIREKQQVRDLDAAELATAKQLKGMIKAFKWNEAVERKGDAARTHFGAMAQDVAAAFKANKLNPEQYGLFCKDVWHTLNGETVIVDEDGMASIIHHELDGEVVVCDEEGKLPEGAIQIVSKVQAEPHERLGLRYEQLLAFIIAAI
jgi:hypothetical protein